MPYDDYDDDADEYDDYDDEGDQELEYEGEMIHTCTHCGKLNVLFDVLTETWMCKCEYDTHTTRTPKRIPASRITYDPDYRDYIKTWNIPQYRHLKTGNKTYVGF